MPARAKVFRVLMDCHASLAMTSLGDSRMPSNARVLMYFCALLGLRKNRGWVVRDSEVLNARKALKESRGNIL